MNIQEYNAKFNEKVVGSLSVVEEDIKNNNYLPPYLGLIDGNANVVSGLFGYKNESDTSGLGKAMSMYSKFKGENIDMGNLEKCKDFNEICESTLAKQDIKKSAILIELIGTMNYKKPSVVEHIIEENTSTYSTLTYDFVVTEDDIANGLYILYYYLTTYAHSSASSTILLNDRQIAEASGSSKTIYDEKLIDLSTYGITSAGTYTLKVNNYTGGSSAYKNTVKLDLLKL